MRYLFLLLGLSADSNLVFYSFRSYTRHEARRVVLAFSSLFLFSQISPCQFPRSSLGSPICLCVTGLYTIRESVSLLSFSTIVNYKVPTIPEGLPPRTLEESRNGNHHSP